MMSWTEGYDSTGSPPPPDSTHIGPFSDPSQDMVHLDLIYDAGIGNFRLNATRVISDFRNPVDAEIDSNRIYIMENGYDNLAGLYVVHVPVATFPCTPSYGVIIQNICQPDSNSVYISPFGAVPDHITWYDAAGTALRTDTGIMANDSIFNLPSGSYYALTTDNGACGNDSVTFVIPEPMSLVIDSIRHTSCIGCADGEVYFHVINGLPPYLYSVGPDHLSAGVSNFCVTDQNGCVACSSVVILDDPTGILETAESSIGFFPNPANNFVFLKTSHAVINGIKIFDVNGREMEYKKFEGGKNDETGIDLTGIRGGIYNVQLSVNERTINRKLIIIK
jgi:hypothetical protein